MTSRADRSSTGRGRQLSAEDWHERALNFEAAGQFDKAAQCYQHGLALSPFCTNLRDGYIRALDGATAGSAPSPRRRAAAQEPDLDEDGFIVEDDEDDLRAPWFVELYDRSTALMPSRRSLWLAGAAVLALGITTAGIFAASAVSSMVGGLFKGEKLPQVSQLLLPSELSGELAEANLLVSAGLPEDAVGLLRPLRARFPDHTRDVEGALAQALRSVGALKSQDRQYAEAARFYREAAELAPGQALNWIDLGRALRDDARIGSASDDPATRRAILNESEDAFMRALELAPGDAVALYGLARVYDAKNNRGKAASTYESLIAAAPESSEAGMAKIALAQLKRR